MDVNALLRAKHAAEHRLGDGELGGGCECVCE